MSSSPEKACYCDSRQCDICTPEIPRGDLVAAMVDLAASNERACRLVLKADAMAAAIEDSPLKTPGMVRALDAYKIERGGS